MASERRNTGLTIPEMLARLNDLYDKEERLLADIRKLYIQYQQLQEDKELLQSVIMHQSNKQNRMRRFMKK